MNLPRQVGAVASAFLLAALFASLAAPAEGLRTGRLEGKREGEAGETSFSNCASGTELQEAAFFNKVLSSLEVDDRPKGGRRVASRSQRSAETSDDLDLAEDEEEEEKFVPKLLGTFQRLGMNPHPGAATNLAMYPDKQNKITEVVNGTYSSRWSSMWARYQDQITTKVKKQARELKPLKVLLVSPVSNSPRAVDDFEYNMYKLRNNTAGDTFNFALFHYDSDDSTWRQRHWYNEEHGFVLLENRQMCKSETWLMVEPKMARNYDYVWLMDGDLRMDYFSWDLYRSVLAWLDPLVSQPAIVPKGLGERSTDLEELQMVGAYSKRFPVAREVSRSESMAPLLSSKIWPVLYKRLTRNDVRTVWYTNTVWDILAQWAALSCGKTGVLVVNAAPVRHINCHDLIRRTNHTGNGCIRGCGHPDKQNCRGFSRRDREYVRDAMQEICPLPTNEGLANCSHIKYCHEAVYGQSHIRQWMEEPESSTLKAYRYECNYTGVHVGFEALCNMELA
uniref:Uncharacterized protein n=1 Tax=Alexandrium andersonii TaxID=327968 RepID=A0A7S2AXK0_9DINO|mmetsp:Transcript_19476/g.44336  ORF Transcript_19476/g.44336 Transcript_19476/m.44336 type:complete len:506 (+) Transcript_19476:87-1604(+)